MKEVFLNKSLKLLSKNYSYDEETLDRVKYGLETIYITITKLTVIFTISYILGLIKETLIFAFFINFLRMYAYGIHAKKNWQCYVSSIICFIIMPLIFTNININIYLKALISFLSIISMILYAPSDTYKRPIVNKSQRKMLKRNSIIVTIIYIILIFFLDNDFYVNLILLSLITESLLINPYVYRLFNLPYNNYKSYLNS